MNEYISAIEALIQSCFLITAYQLNTDRKTEDMGFISGHLDFFDGSMLDFKEFIEQTETGIEKYKYGYNYRPGTLMVFRYDNAPDPRARHLKSFPHHRHAENGTLAESSTITLPEILSEIEQIILKNW